VTAAMRFCIQCKQTKPDTEFLSFANRAIRVRKCNACAQSNMARYWKSMSLVTDPAKMARDARE
jgi:RNA polymerase subunit RPABC4/transcription elongation factor Spt4